MASERLDKRVASSFGLSRAQAQEAIKRGRVHVDGAAVKRPEEKPPAGAVIELDGQAGKSEKYVYIMMDKPEGYLSATEDKNDRTVLELLPQNLRRRSLGIVGRLDKDVSGFLLITDDGELNHRLTSPRRHVDKVYEAWLDGPVGQDEVDAFAAGLELSDFTARPALLQPDEDDPCHCHVTISEGRFHQVKRMFERVGRHVAALRRISIGGLCLDGSLGRGGWRKLSNEEREYLERKCGIRQ